MRPRLHALLATVLTATTEQVSTDGVEREYVFFGQMTHPEDLKEAAGFEDQEQWRIKVPAKEKDREITVRIRKTVRYTVHGNDETSPHDPEYTLTIKSFVKGEKGNVEAESELPPEQGEKMLAVFKKEGDGMIKRRYFFPAGYGYNPDSDEKFGVRMSLDSCWEVDVFEGHDGKGAWVKLDFEVEKFDLKVKDDISMFPFPSA